jgi:mannosyltransferase OCH1-like enzyme
MNFNDLMYNSSGYKNRTLQDKWDILEKAYYNHIQPAGTQKIPKLIHQIWLGDGIPNDLYDCIDSIKESNPGYKHMLWTDEEVKDFDFKNKQLFNSCKNLGQKSDILRYAILERFGGIYLDMDFIGIKSFDELLHLDFFTGVAYDNEPTLFNGLIGCIPGHELTKELNNIEEVSDYDGMAVIKTTGPWYLTKKFFKKIKQLNDVIALPVSYFYPYPNFDRDRVKGTNHMEYINVNKTICIHLWNSRWN